MVETAVQQYASGPDATRALELYAEVHWLTAYTLFRAGERGESSRIAADRFAAAARRVGDPLLMAASARCLGHVLLHGGQTEAARTVIREALDALAPGLGTADERYLSVYGALLLAAAVIEARLGDGVACRRLLGEAAGRRARLGPACSGAARGRQRGDGFARDRPVRRTWHYCAQAGAGAAAT